MAVSSHRSLVCLCNGLESRIPFARATLKSRNVTETPPLVALTRVPGPPPCISYANVHNYSGPYAYCSLDKGVACTQHIQLPTHTCAAGHMC